MKSYWGGGIAPRVLDLSTRRKCVIRFTLRQLYPRGKTPQYLLDKRLGEPQSRSGRGVEEKNFQPPPGIELPNPHRLTHTQVKVKFFLFLTKHHATKAYWGVEV
jgi:hypothetical protein